MNNQKTDNSQQPLSLSPVESALSGALAGGISRFFVAPLDVVKIRLQLQQKILKKPLEISKKI